MTATNATQAPADTPEARRYNRIRRRLEVADLALGFFVLTVLLLTGWTGTLRDVAYRGAHQIYSLAVFFYVAMLLLISKLLGSGLDYYSFRLEHRYNLSNQKLKPWLRDELKGWLVGLGVATLLVELLYFTIRQFPLHWWFIAWGVF